MTELLRVFRDDHHLWCMTGTRRLASLSIGQAEGVR
ncbi:hypothetical protein HU200_011131 [Digitaria exilis]|uniref:Uncharacterized protein n=1 Tax=Digitaria exilis TaxID=1010633 RepID=A0A835KMY8_9POAL|nr:hypothetical protein HU200_011131 [Digitaria exilis]